MSSMGKVLTVALVVAAAACSRRVVSPAGTATVASPAAAYTLAAVAGQPVPAVAYFGVDVAIRATSGRLTLSPNHAYALEVAYTQHLASGNRNRSFTLAERGRWTATDSGVQLDAKGHSARRATISGDTATLTLTVPDAAPPERATKVYTFVRAR